MAVSLALFRGTFRIEIDGKDASDRTSLHLASMENHPDVIKILLGAQAVDSYVDLQGLTALHYAVENNSLASLRAFAEMNDLTHIPDSVGRTPLMVAAQNGFDQAVEILIENPSVAQSIDYADGEGKSGMFVHARKTSNARSYQLHVPTYLYRHACNFSQFIFVRGLPQRRIPQLEKFKRFHLARTKVRS